MALQISSLDLAIVVMYLVGVVGLGCWVGAQRRKGGEGSHYFLAGNTLDLARHRPGDVRREYLDGAPGQPGGDGLHLRPGVQRQLRVDGRAGRSCSCRSSSPRSISARACPRCPSSSNAAINRHCRDWLAVISIFSAVVIHIGVALYTAALGAPRASWASTPTATILGIDATMFFIIVLGVLTGIYTMIGGLLAVVWTESIQTVLLLVGAVCITVVGYLRGGRLDRAGPDAGTQYPHPLPAAPYPRSCVVNWYTHKLPHMVRGPNDPSKSAVLRACCWATR